MKKVLHRALGCLLLCCLMVLLNGCSLFHKKAVDVSEKHDWVVVSDPSTVKAKNEYDVIVVGGGIGGLSCGSLLAETGYKVLLLEQQSQVGGYCTSYNRNGFVFPVGAHDIGGCERGAIGTLLNKLKLKKDDLFVLNSRTYILGDKGVTFTGAKNDVVKKLSELFPDEHHQLVAFFNEAEQAFDEMRASIKDPNHPCPTYDAWKKVTYQQKLDEYFHDAELKRFLCSLLGYLGTEPDKTAAGDALGACLSYFIYGGYYPKSGGKLFADALQHAIESHGGAVLTGTRVDEILVADNHVTGVRAGDKKFFSPIVVANVNAKTTFLQLLPPGALDPLFIDAIGRLKMSFSEAKVNLGVDLDLSSLSSIIVVYKTPKEGARAGEEYGLSINSNADPTTAPAGKASISLGIDALYSEVPPAGTPEYEKYKERLATSAIAKAEKILPGVSEHIVVKDVITPRTFESFTSMPEGALYSFDQSKGSKRPYFKTPVKGLYLASSSTFPGGGVESVVVSGLICVRDIESHRKEQTLDGNEVILSPPSLSSAMSIEQAIKERRSIRHFSALPLSLSDISQLLWAAAGITHDGRLRAAPSAGALYPLEIYVVAVNVTGLPVGVYKYNVQKKALKSLVDGDFSAQLCVASYSQKCIREAAASMIICGVYERESKKYGKDAQQFTAIEVGCVAENVALQATSLGIGTVCVGGFKPEEVQKILTIPQDERPLCIMPFGNVL